MLKYFTKILRNLGKLSNILCKFRENLRTFEENF